MYLIYIFDHIKFGKSTNQLEEQSDERTRVISCKIIRFSIFIVQFVSITAPTSTAATAGTNPTKPTTDIDPTSQREIAIYSTGFEPRYYVNKLGSDLEVQLSQ